MSCLLSAVLHTREVTCGIKLRQFTSPAGDIDVYILCSRLPARLHACMASLLRVQLLFCAGANRRAASEHCHAAWLWSWARVEGIAAVADALWRSS